MASDLANSWTEKVRLSLSRYEEPLLRQTANHLLRPRTKRPAKDLIDKMASAMDNAALIDRRLATVDDVGRNLLAMIGMSRRPVWNFYSAVELVEAVRPNCGPDPVWQLLEAGLLFPDVAEDSLKIKAFPEWLARTPASECRIFAHPEVTARFAGDDIASVADVSQAGYRGEVSSLREADGLEIPLRLAVLWQQVKTTPLRLTQQGEFFKRDYDRLADVILSGPAADELHALPNFGHFLVGLGLGIGLLRLEEGEVAVGNWPNEWQTGLNETLAQLWSCLPLVESWNAAEGWRGLSAERSGYASAGLLVLALLSRLPEGAWISPEQVSNWLSEHHISWRDEPRRKDIGDWAQRFLLGLAYSLRLVQAGKDDGGAWVVRLSAYGEAAMGLKPPVPRPSFPQTLIVQPNLEIMAYRQGLTPSLIARLSEFCTWKSLGAACLLQLEPESVYRGLEAGLDYDQMLQLLQQHSGKEVPTNVVQLLRTWADKRERLTVYPAAMLLEFSSLEDLQDALGRGLPGLRIADRLLLVARESDIDYKHFTLSATRDYSAPPDRCVEVGPDGVTLAVDLARADLLLETEMQTFADATPSADSNGRRVYQLTPTSLSRGRERGLTANGLEDWFYERSGQTLSPAARLLLAGANLPPLTVKRLLVVEAPSETVADGLLQWPATRELIQCRLGPRAFAVEEQNLARLQKRMQEIGVQCGT